MYHSFLIHSSVDEHLGSLHVVVIVNSAIGINSERWGLCTDLFQFGFIQGIYLEVVLLDHMVVLFLVFKGNSTLSSIVAVSICIPTSSTREFPRLHTLSSIYCL